MWGSYSSRTTCPVIHGGSNALSNARSGSGNLVLVPLKVPRVLPFAYPGPPYIRFMFLLPNVRPIFPPATEKQQFKAMVKAARLRRVRFERMQREALVRQRAEAAVRAVFLQNRERAARAIQVPE